MFAQFSLHACIFSQQGNGEHTEWSGQKEFDKGESRVRVRWKHGMVVLFKTYKKEHNI